jgi:hypothetical protein
MSETRAQRWTLFFDRDNTICDRVVCLSRVARLRIVSCAAATICKLDESREPDLAGHSADCRYNRISLPRLSPKSPMGYWSNLDEAPHAR